LADGPRLSSITYTLQVRINIKNLILGSRLVLH
jgi:hypothetical protein